MAVWSPVIVAVGSDAESAARPRRAPTSTTATASSSATRCASWGCRSARSTTIEPQPERVKITFWVDDKYKVPAEAKAVILSPTLVTARAIQLTPAYTGGPVMADGAVIPQDRTAVPVEWDDLREQLEKLTETLQPTQPGGVSTLGAFVNTAADNLRGQGANIRETADQAVPGALGPRRPQQRHLRHTQESVGAGVGAAGQHRSDASAQRQPGGGDRLLANDPNEVGHAVKDLNAAVGDVGRFVADNRERIGTTSDKLASVSQALVDSLDDIKQTAARRSRTTFQNFAQHLSTGAGHADRRAGGQQLRQPDHLHLRRDPGRVAAECRAVGETVRAISRADRQEPPVQLPAVGENLFVGAQARPNEVTYSEDWMRPDYVPPQSSSRHRRRRPAPDVAPGSPYAPAPPLPADGRTDRSGTAVCRA